MPKMINPLDAYKKLYLMFVNKFGVYPATGVLIFNVYDMPCGVYLLMEDLTIDGRTNKLSFMLFACSVSTQERHWATMLDYRDIQLHMCMWDQLKTYPTHINVNGGTCVFVFGRSIVIRKSCVVYEYEPWVEPWVQSAVVDNMVSKGELI